MTWFLLLRYLKHHDFLAVGVALGVSEDAAQKRVSRALEKLRRFLSGSGVELSVTALSTTLATAAVALAPSGLAGSVAASAVAGATVGAGVSLNLINLITMTKLKTAVAGVLVLAGLATPLILQHRSLNRIRGENQALLQQSEELVRLQTENKRLAQRQIDDDELARLRNERSELMRLRGEMAGLREQLKKASAKLESRAPAPAASGVEAPQPAVSPVETRGWRGSFPRPIHRHHTPGLGGPHVGRSDNDRSGEACRGGSAVKGRCN